MSEKSEEPTAKKLRDAREEGQVAHSKDLTQTVLVCALFGYLSADGPSFIDSLARLILIPVASLQLDFHTAVNAVFYNLFIEGALILLPFVLIVLIVGVFVESMQVGIFFSFKALKPSGRKLNVASNAKNMFSMKNMVEFFKSTLKVTFLSGLLLILVSNSLPKLMTIPLAGLEGVGQSVAQLLSLMIINIAIAYSVIAVADLIWQRHKHRKDLMMTKDEVRREYKEMEGNQEIKHQRKHLHQELLMSGAVEKSRTATALITNPTHLAIAIRFERRSVPLPVVLAKGDGLLAERMVMAARRAGVPVVQNIPLARSLMEHSNVDQYIPSELIEPVAEVLRILQEFSQKESALD